MQYRDKFCRPTVSQFLRDEHGSATIEFVLWVPIFVAVLVAATDANVLYLHHTEMSNVSRDVARRGAVGDMTEADAVNVVGNEMFLYRRAYTVSTSTPTDLEVQIRIRTSVAGASMFGFFEPVPGRYLTAMHHAPGADLSQDGEV